MHTNDHVKCCDDDLLLLLQNGEKWAFDEIYARYWEKLFVYLIKVVTDKEEASDILQEIFISLWHRRFSLGGISSLKAYLFMSAKYKSLDYIKENINKNRYLESITVFFDRQNDSMEEQYAADELSILIDKEIDRLPPKMREVFILSRRENLSHKMISEKLMISEKTVKKQINNVLKVLRLKFTTGKSL